MPQALTSLKYFYEDAPEYHVMTAGSLLGVALHAETSFPTGKVEFLNLYPLSFGEFLNALDQHPLNDLIKSSNWSMIKRFSEVLSTHLRWYYLVGGMPEVVGDFALNQDFKRVKQIQSDILNAYEQDFSKHAPIREVPRIRMVWNSIPSQLAKDNKKFIYGQLRSGARSKDYELAIQWLIDSGLAHRVTHVAKANVPLKAYEEAAYFKLYMLDVGLLSALSNLNAQTVIEKHRLFTEFKGALTEQFVMQELLHNNNNIHYWTSKASAELDFLIEYQNQIIPIEVKAEENLQSKSLKVFRDKYNPDTCFRFSMSHYRNESWLINIPLYAVGEFLNEPNK